MNNLSYGELYHLFLMKVQVADIENIYMQRTFNYLQDMESKDSGAIPSETEIPETYRTILKSMLS